MESMSKEKLETSYSETSANNVQYTPIYPDIFPYVSTIGFDQTQFSDNTLPNTVIPNAPTSQFFGTHVEKSDFLAFCRDIKLLLTPDADITNTIRNKIAGDINPNRKTNNSSNNTQSLQYHNYDSTNNHTLSTSNNRENKTIVIKEKTIVKDPYYVPHFSPYYYPPTTTIVNNYSDSQQVVSKNPEYNIEKKKKKESNEYSFTQKVVSTTILAVAVPVAAHYISKDYNRYMIYERVEKQYYLWLPLLETPSNSLISKMGTSSAYLEFCAILKLWKKVRKDIWEEIASSAKNKATGGLGLVATGVSLVLGSTLGFLGGAILTTYTITKYVWNNNTIKHHENDKHILLSKIYTILLTE